MSEVIRLVYKENGQEVKEGDVLTDFRDERWKFISLVGHKVYVKGAKPGVWEHGREFYVTVFPEVQLAD